MTFAELNARVDAVAQGLVSVGVSKGDSVALHDARSAGIRLLDARGDESGRGVRPL